MYNDGVLIKGNREGINATINMSRFASFEDMLQLLIRKLSKGKHFYKGTTLILRLDLKSISKNNVHTLRETLLKEIDLKDIILEDIEQYVDKLEDPKRRLRK